MPCSPELGGGEGFDCNDMVNFVVHPTLMPKAPGQVVALRAHCVHTAHAEARILTQEYLSPVARRSNKAHMRTKKLPSTWYSTVPMNKPLSLLGVPILGRNQYGYITPTFSGSPWWGEINMATSPLPSRGPHTYRHLR